MITVTQTEFPFSTDGLVSYSAPIGQEMALHGQNVSLNDTVYDGAVGNRWITSCSLVLANIVLLNKFVAEYSVGF